MKHFIILIFCTLFLQLSAISQDLIIKTNGDTLKCEIIDLGVDVIQCIKYNSPDQTVYRILTKDVSSIIYDSGEKTSLENQKPEGYLYRDKPLTMEKKFLGQKIWLGMRELKKPELRYLYAPYPDIFKDYQKGRRLISWGSVIAMPGAFLLGYSIGYMVVSGETNTEVLLIGCGALFSGLVMVWAGNTHVRSCVSRYNRDMGEKYSLTLQIGFSPQGMGLRLAF